jgi:hypothetical protein
MGLIVYREDVAYIITYITQSVQRRIGEIGRNICVGGAVRRM